MNLAWPALGWGLVLVAALIGWGRLLSRLVFRAPAPWLLAGAWGVALTVLLGGLVNTLAWFSSGAVIGFVSLGAIACGAELALDRANVRRRFAIAWRCVRGDWLVLVLLTLVLAILALRYTSAPVRRNFHFHPDFGGMPFNPHDDMQSYLVMPEKLLQVGQLTPDPYNTRQLEATLGGMHVLTALGRAALPMEALHVVEESVGLLLACGALAAVLLRLRVRPRMLVFLLLVAQCSFEHNLNISSYLSAAAVIGAIFVLLLEDDAARFWSPRWSIALGLLLATAAALKSTLIPLVGLLVAVALLVHLIARPERRAFRAAGIAATVLLAALLPWMALKYRTYGTPLFPLLGKGKHWTRYYAPPTDATASTWEIFRRESGRGLWSPTAAGVLAGLVAAVPAFRRRIAPPVRAIIIGGGTAWCVSTFAMGWPGGGFDVSRYVWPLAIVYVPATFAALGEAVRSIQRVLPLRIALLVWCTALGGWLWHHHGYTYVYLGLAAADDLAPGRARVPMENDRLRTASQRLQASVPPGAALLARVTHPFLFDFRRNPIFVPDWPGGASPPPGLPMFRGPEPVAQYLLSQGIRYVAYSYRYEAFFSRRDFGWRTEPDQPAWERQVARMAFDFQSNLELLGITRRRIFDDGETFVLDLGGELGR